MYYKKDTKVGSHNFGYQIWFCTKLIKIFIEESDKKGDSHLSQDQWVNILMI